MAYLYKLIFDISVYFGITGFYLQLYADVVVSFAGLVLLITALVSYKFLSDKYPEKHIRYLVFLLPAFTLLFTHSIFSLIHLAIAWSYGTYCAITEKAPLTYAGFRTRFVRSLVLLIAFIPPLINHPMAKEALSDSSVYVIIQLLCGVSGIRCLREKRDDIRQMLVLLAGTAVLGVLTLLGVPQFIVRCLNDYVLQVLINGVLLICLLFAALIFELFNWLMSINGPPNRPDGISLDTESIADIMGIDPSQMQSPDADFFWLNMIGYIVGAIAILVVLIILVRKLIKSAKNRLHKDNQKGWSIERQQLATQQRSRRRSRRKPQEPRALVRYYYAKYMRECEKRGVNVRRDWTSQELSNASLPYFSKDDIQSMKAIYRSARYHLKEKVAAQDAKQASKLLQSIKKTK